MNPYHKAQNLYVYCASDPINSVDPTGENWVVDKLGGNSKLCFKGVGILGTKQAQRDFWWCGAEWYLKTEWIFDFCMDVRKFIAR